VLVALLAVSITGCQSRDKAEAASADQPQGFWQKLTREPLRITIPSGTRLDVRLAESLSSSGNRSGDTFAATLDEPIVLDNLVAVPTGAKLTGRVTDATASGHLKTPAELALTLTSLEVGGKAYDISTSTYGRRGRSHKKHDAAWIGGASAGGALLGALAGGGKGAAIGAGIGAGGGTAAAYATGKKDIVLPAESIIRFNLHEPVTITKQG
jgi:hypothetical protein